MSSLVSTSPPQVPQSPPHSPPAVIPVSRTATTGLYADLHARLAGSTSAAHTSGAAPVAMPPIPGTIVPPVAMSPINGTVVQGRVTPGHYPSLAPVTVIDPFNDMSLLPADSSGISYQERPVATGTPVTFGDGATKKDVDPFKILFESAYNSQQASIYPSTAKATSDMNVILGNIREMSQADKALEESLDKILQEHYTVFAKKADGTDADVAKIVDNLKIVAQQLTAGYQSYLESESSFQVAPGKTMFSPEQIAFHKKLFSESAQAAVVKILIGAQAAKVRAVGFLPPDMLASWTGYFCHLAQKTNPDEGDVDLRASLKDRVVHIIEGDVPSIVPKGVRFTADPVPALSFKAEVLAPMELAQNRRTTHVVAQHMLFTSLFGPKEKMEESIQAEFKRLANNFLALEAMGPTYTDEYLEVKHDIIKLEQLIKSYQLVYPGAANKIPELIENSLGSLRDRADAIAETESRLVKGDHHIRTKRCMLERTGTSLLSDPRYRKMDYQMRILTAMLKFQSLSVPSNTFPFAFSSKVKLHIAMRLTQVPVFDPSTLIPPQFTSLYKLRDEYRAETDETRTDTDIRNANLLGNLDAIDHHVPGYKDSVLRQIGEELDGDGNPKCGTDDPIEWAKANICHHLDPLKRIIDEMEWDSMNTFCFGPKP